MNYFLLCLSHVSSALKSYPLSHVSAFVQCEIVKNETIVVCLTFLCLFLLTIPVFFMIFQYSGPMCEKALVKRSIFEKENNVCVSILKAVLTKLRGIDRKDFKNPIQT